MNGYKIATRFITRIVVGCILAIFIGLKIDEWIHTTPFIMVILLMYVMIGSMVLLVKEFSNGRKS